jgi:hypothetical protein
VVGVGSESIASLACSWVSKSASAMHSALG